MPKKPRLCFVGNMLGRNAGYITTQGQIAADLFAAAGYEVTSVSSKINRVARLAEIAAVLVKNRRRFDIVLLEVYSGLSFITAQVASLICRTFKIPLIMVLHGGNLPELIEKSPNRAQKVIRRADCLVAPSAFLAKRIGVHGFEIKVVPNIIELDAYPFRERSRINPRFLWMRSFHPLYNPEMALKVFAEVRKDYPNATLTMAGVDKGLEPEIKKTAEQMNLLESVSFPGFLNAEQKQRVFSEADIFLNTNRTDNMPVAVVEACACGLPVVATDVGGLPFLISHGKNGLLVANENVAEMAAAVKSLLENADLTQKISRGARALAECSGWERTRTEWEQLFAQVLEKKTENSAASFTATELPAEK